MSYQERYHEWACQVATIIYNKNEEQRRRNKLIVAVYIAKLKKKYKKRDFGLIHYLKDDVNMVFTTHLFQD